MKLFIALLALVGLSYSAPQEVTILQELTQFLTVLPMNDLRRVAIDHYENDPEYQAGVQFLQSKEFRQMTKDLLTKPSVKEMRMLVRDAGLDTDMILNMMYALLDLARVSAPEGQRKSFKKFLDEINDLIPWEKLLDMLAEKLENSPSFKRFFNAITSTRMHELGNKVMASKEFERLAAALMEMDVPVLDIIETVYNLFGWKDSEVLPNDLDEVVASVL